MRFIQGHLRYNRRGRRIMTNRHPYNSIYRKDRRGILTRRVGICSSNHGAFSSQQGLAIVRMRPGSKYSRA